jgi:alpha-tubulin suppressor-like RCC1 family protein
MVLYGHGDTIYMVNLVRVPQPINPHQSIPGTSWNDIAGGCRHSLARKTDGTLWSWGYNLYGQLGEGTTTNKSSPIQIPGTSWNDIAGGTNHSLARKTF